VPIGSFVLETLAAPVGVPGAGRRQSA